MSEMKPEKRMTREEALRLLAECEKSHDTERAHADADDVLCALLIALGYRDVVDAYHRVAKWYA